MCAGGTIIFKSGCQEMFAECLKDFLHNTRPLHKWGLLLTALTSVVTLLTIECATFYVRGYIHARGSGYHENNVPCHKWPTLAEAYHIVEQHASVISQMQALYSPGGQVFVYVSESTRGWPFGKGWPVSRTCEGKGNLRIEYPGDVEKIRAVIGDDIYFFGIPYSLYDY